MRKLILLAAVFVLSGLSAVHAAQAASGGSVMVSASFKILDAKKSYGLCKIPHRIGINAGIKICLSRITAELVNITFAGNTPEDIKKYIQANAREIDLTVVHSPPNALTTVADDGISDAVENDLVTDYKHNKNKSYKGRIKVTFDQRGVRATELVEVEPGSPRPPVSSGPVHSGTVAEPCDP